MGKKVKTLKQNEFHSSLFDVANNLQINANDIVDCN